LSTKKHRQRQNNGFVDVYPLGLFRSNGSGYAAVDKDLNSILPNDKTGYLYQPLNQKLFKALSSRQTVNNYGMRPIP
jgi:hypothetical protein